MIIKPDVYDIQGVPTPCIRVEGSKDEECPQPIRSGYMISIEHHVGGDWTAWITGGIRVRHSVDEYEILKRIYRRVQGE